MADKALLDAFYLLSDVADALTVGTYGTGTWWRSQGVQKRLTDASNDFGLAAAHLAEAELPVDPELLARAKGWAADAPKTPELREDRDGVLKLLGVVEHLVRTKGLDSDQARAEWFSKGGGSSWDRVKNERGKVRTNHNAG